MQTTPLQGVPPNETTLSKIVSFFNTFVKGTWNEFPNLRRKKKPAGPQTGKPAGRVIP